MAKFETRFSCGDKAWIFDGEHGAQQVTVGQIRIEYTHSKGLRGGCVDDEFPTIAFDNYMPKAAKYEEVYMCVETGIGSGSLHTLGKHIFATEAECIAANAERIEANKKAEQERLAREREYLLAQQRDIERKLSALPA